MARERFVALDRRVSAGPRSTEKSEQVECFALKCGFCFSQADDVEIPCQAVEKASFWRVGGAVYG